jgi:LysM repeat protein
LAAVSRYFAHAIVLLVAITLAGYASISKNLPASASLRLGVVNAEGLALGEGGAAGSVQLGRAGTIIMPAEVPTQPQVQRTPITYTVKNGDDLYAIADRFGVSANDIRWSDMPKLAKTDRLTPGDHLLIPPVPGIVVAVRAGDTTATIAKAYRVSAQAVSDFNALRDPNSVAAGRLVVVPNGVGAQLWPRRASDQAPHLGPFPNSKFAFGQCTWYAASRRSVPWSGNAWMWYGNARAMGYAVGQTPEPGAFMITWESAFFGHVAYVEQVNEDGSFVVSEMNFNGWDMIDTRTLKSPREVPLIGFIY